ncbi:Citrate synthase (si) [Pseudonocardia sp. Ae168_Ps1]|uniref:citrate synthase n=1 Tax=unclassified Pseudonocardia TaxID=2619320 RepID=UPI00094B4509|nr:MULTISPECIES: citrate synthase [unclassified Pseudonocardia]OLL82183.1 Citrate synthase (si) [Pseudonocardia sp. Ae168_Ps1]OLL83702.1 Citrate synthase (si) [Pseudonocardia sp. Ae263_Ps1]OLL90257.1 Citrate synthase (si) [Pseudonocardia sp. Ae356_Ps1]
MEFLNAAETAERLGVKRETVYAYASRGLLTSVRGAQRRGSRFAQDEVEALAARGREAGEPSGAVERIRTRITLVADGGPWFRGVPVGELAVAGTLGDAAAVLWEPPGPVAFDADPALLPVARGALAALPGGARTTDRFRVAVAALAAADPLRADVAPAAVVRTASGLLGTVVDALAGGGDGPLAARLWPALARDPDGEPPPAALDHVRAALVLLADHGLAASTVAARGAASTLADVHAVVSAGLGALDGPRHGLASGLAHRFLAGALDDPRGALAERLRAGERVPGFGHTVYRGPDPRATVLLDRLRDDPAAERVLACVDAVAGDLDRGGEGPAPNVDLALAALLHAHGLRRDAGELLFATARTVGWVAHAREEYAEPGLRFRPSGVYTGPRPGSREHPPGTAG